MRRRPRLLRHRVPQGVSFICYAADGSAATRLRTAWNYEVVDKHRVPIYYLKVDDTAIRAAMKHRDGTGKPTATISGIRWVADEKLDFY